MRMLIPMLLVLAAGNIGCSNIPPTPTPPGVQAPAAEPVTSPFTDLSETTDLRKLLCQNWEHKEDAEDAEASGSGGSLDMPYRGIAMFDDGTVTENPRDKIRFGKWSFDETKKLLHLEISNGSAIHYKIGAIGPRELVLQNLSDKKTTAYRADAKFSPEPKLNPFHPSNNKWRLKPARREGESELKARTMAALDFYAKFLTDNAAREGGVISFVGFPGCFKWYNGGISISSESNLGDKWIHCFYNQEQALQARQLLEDIISKKYKWNKEEANWVKQSADILKQMKDTLQRL